jgi:hypothetical protein
LVLVVSSETNVVMLTAYPSAAQADQRDQAVPSYRQAQGRPVYAAHPFTFPTGINVIAAKRRISDH